MIKINDDILNKVLQTNGYTCPNVQKCKDGKMRVFFTHYLCINNTYAIELDKFIEMYNNYLEQSKNNVHKSTTTQKERYSKRKAVQVKRVFVMAPQFRQNVLGMSIYHN